MHAKLYRLIIVAICAFFIAHSALAVHSPRSLPIYNDPLGALETDPASMMPTSRPIEAPAETLKTSTSTQTDEKILKAVEDFGTRIGDLFVCVPGKIDSLYSTQSWYMLNTFLSFNNNVARSTLGKDTVFGEELKIRIVAKALSQIKARNPGLEKSESIQKYLGSVANTTELVFKSALDTRTTYAKSVDIDSLIAKSHKEGESNVFAKLKAAHAEHKELLTRKECMGLKKNFWETPHFAFTQSQESAAAVKQAGTSTSTTTKSKSSSTSKKKPSTGDSSTSGTTHKVSDRPVIAVNAADIDARYGRSKRISAQLPYSAWESRKVNGYHTYYGKNGYLWGRPYVIGNIMKAANVLKDKGIYMGVGDINRKPGAWPYHRETPGHGSHDQGRAVDLRLIGPDGEARPCTVTQPSCYDRGKTFEMIKALIDADPKELRVIYINDPKLRGMIEDYLVSAYGWSRGAADEAVQYWPCHDNHVHFHWRNDYAKR